MCQATVGRVYYAVLYNLSKGVSCAKNKGSASPILFCSFRRRRSSLVVPRETYIKAMQNSPPPISLSRRRCCVIRNLSGLGGQFSETLAMFFKCRLFLHNPASHLFSPRTSPMFFYPRGCNLSYD